MLDEGNYRGRPIRAALGITGTGKEQIGVQFELTEPAGQRITWYGYFTEGTFDRTIEALRSCGWAGTDLAEFQGEVLPVGFDQEVELVIKHEEYPEHSGKYNAKVAFINSGGGLAMKEALDSSAARSFGARMKGRIAAFDRSGGRKPAPRARAAPADQVPQDVLDSQEQSNLSNEDIPF